MRLIKRIIIFSTALSLLVLALANTHAVDIYLPLMEESSASFPVYILFFLGMVVGVGISGIAGISLRLRQQQSLRHQKKALHQLEKKVKKADESTQSMLASVSPSPLS